MRQNPLVAIATLVLACSSPAQAIDFHPLVSQDLAGGVYEYDNIFIPEGVTLTLVGEPRQATLRALGDLTLAGSLIAPGWEVHLEARDSLQVLGAIDVWGGTLSLVSLAGDAGQGTLVVIPGRDIDDPRAILRPESRFQGTLISLASGGELALLNAWGSTTAGLSLTANGPIAVQGIVPASILPSSRVTILGWQRFDVAAGGSLSFAESPEVANLVLSGRAVESGYLRIASEGVLLRNDGSIEISAIRILDPAEFQTGPALLVIEPGMPVPEPETWAMLLAGLGLVGWRRW